MSDLVKLIKSQAELQAQEKALKEQAKNLNVTITTKEGDVIATGELIVKYYTYLPNQSI